MWTGRGEWSCQLSYIIHTDTDTHTHTHTHTTTRTHTFIHTEKTTTHKHVHMQVVLTCMCTVLTHTSTCLLCHTQTHTHHKRLKAPFVSPIPVLLRVMYMSVKCVCGFCLFFLSVCALLCVSEHVQTSF